MRLPLLLLLLTAAMVTAPAHAQERDLTAGLKRGMNLSHWYSQTLVGNYDDPHLSTYFTQNDAQKIAGLGFDHVRLTLNQSVLFDPAHPGTLKADPLARMKTRLQFLLDAGLNVVVDLHPDDDYKESLLEPAHADGFVADWGALAAAYADVSADRLVFEVLNEPLNWEGAPWRELQGRAVEAIRASAPDHRIIVNEGKWSGIDALSAFEPYDDANLIYTFHFYDPFYFTHQSAEWLAPTVINLQGVSWPIAADTSEEDLRAMTRSDESFNALLSAVREGQFTEETLHEKFERLAAWQAEHNVPIYLGEFGVYVGGADPAVRAHWIESVRKEAEAHDWGWAMWDYAQGFGIVEGEDRTPNPTIVEALGL